MQKIITATGREFIVEWCGQSTIDFTLRFAIKNNNMAEVVNVFMNPAETSTIIHEMDEMGTRTIYTGFTTFRGVDAKPDGTIVVSLMQ